MKFKIAKDQGNLGYLGIFKKSALKKLEEIIESRRVASAPQGRDRGHEFCNANQRLERTPEVGFGVAAHAVGRDRASWPRG